MDTFFPLTDIAPRLAMLFSLKKFGMNILDIIILLVIFFYSYEGYVVGFGLAVLDLCSFILSFLLGLLIFDKVSPVLVSVFSLPQGFANATSFFLVALLSEIALSLILRRLFVRARALFQKREHITLFQVLNHPLGILPGLASSYIIVSFVLTVIIALPSSPVLKQLVTTSAFGSVLVSHTTSIQHALNTVFGGAIQETLHVLTIKPQSDEIINLNFTVATPTIDGESEEQMLSLINRERTKKGLPPLRMDENLREVARSHANDMLQRGYFSHYTLEGMSPFDRMNKFGIAFIDAGENLALAPSTSIAHQGLMNSPGHRANILGPTFHKVGIGVLDGGIYGKMFVQEFTN